MNLLNLPGWTIVTYAENDHDFAVEATYPKIPSGCPKCGAEGQMVKFGSTVQRIMHTPAHGKRMGINLKRVRQRCKACMATSVQPVPEIHESGSMTKALVEYIERQSLDRTFTSIADEVGVDEKTVRNVFNAYTNYLDKTVRFATPEWLGIDEIHLLNGARCVLTNIKAGTVIDMLPDRNKATLHERLFWMPDKERVKVVTMDMYRPYRDAVRAILPDAQVVVDKFHIVRMATVALETVRRGLKAELSPGDRRKLMRSRWLLLKRRRDLDQAALDTLETWTACLPALNLAYIYKEGFYDIFDFKTARRAWEHYEQWEWSMPPVIRPVFKPVMTAMNNWKPEILNYFTHRATNAMTEALNGIMRVVNRGGRGYSFKAIRAKTIYSKSLRVEKPRFGGKPSKRMRDAEQAALTRAEAADLHVTDGVDYHELAARIQRQIDEERVERESGGSTPSSE